MDDPQPFPEPHVILPTSIHTHTVVLLHGRGSNGEEFADEFFQGETSSEESLLQLFPGFKWIFPTAHQSFSTVFQEDLVEWFDIYSLTDPSSREELQIDGLRDSVAFIQGLIDKEVQAWGPSAQDRIILGGISQGCAVAITALLTGACGIGAFVGFNGWMPLARRVKHVISEAPGNHDAHEKEACERLATALRTSLSFNEEKGLHPSSCMPNDSSTTELSEHVHTPVFLSHTSDDNVVEIALGREMRDTLVKGGMQKVVWKEYETGGHWIPAPEGFEDLADFLS